MKGCWVGRMLVQMRSGHRSDACDLSAFSVNPFELLGKLVERNVEDSVTAGIARDAPQIVGAVARDFHAVGHALLAGTSTQPGRCILQIGGRAETPACGLSG